MHLQEILGSNIFGPSKDDDGGEDDASPDDENRKDSDVEPVFYHFLPKIVYDNMIGSWSITAVLDCTPGQGEFAKACIEKRIPYLGVCLTEAHAVKLKQDLGSVHAVRCC